MKKFLLPCLFLLVLRFNGHTQVLNPFEPLQKYSYFDAYLFLQNNKEKYSGDKFENQYWQAFGTLSAFLGQYLKAENCYFIRDSIFKNKPDTIIKYDISKYAISQVQLNVLYNSNDVLLINEAHYKSEHRAFLYNQLPFFKANGFKYIAIEALNNGTWLDSLLYSRRYPQYLKTGIYIDDPVFANLIRRAIELDFTIIAYDHYGIGREEEQAKNILKQYNPSNGKLLVFAGYAHICEEIDSKLMGSFLKKELGHEILTISQCISNEMQFKNRDSIQSYLIKSEIDCYDYFFLPWIKKDSINIPGWYELLNFNYKYLSEFYKKEIEIPSLIQVFYPDEQNGIPVYQYLKEKETEKDILLAFPKKAEYILIIKNEKECDSLRIVVE